MRPRQLSYPRHILLGDLTRTMMGSLGCGLLLVIVRPTVTVQVILLVLILVFVAFAFQVIARWNVELELADDGVRLRRRDNVLRWRDLQHFKLEYYSTRRDGRNGWYRLRLRAKDQSLDVDSHLQGFDALLQCSVDAATRNELSLDTASAANLQRLLARDAL